MQGPPGSQGLPGPAGVGHVYFTKNAGNGSINTGADIISLNLPAGSYLITFNSLFDNLDGDVQRVTCDVSTGASITNVITSLTDTLTDTFMSLQDVAQFSVPTTVKVRCGGYRIQVSNPTLSAVQVGGIN
jgi:hypothetical protein